MGSDISEVRYQREVRVLDVVCFKEGALERA